MNEQEKINPMPLLYGETIDEYDRVRDMFAAHAMEVFLRDVALYYDHEAIAHESYILADAMMAERGKKK